MAEIRTPSTSPTTPLGGPFTSFGLISAPGFSSIAIPIPHGSLYLSPMVSAEPAPITIPVNLPSRATSNRRLPPPPQKPESNGAYTLLIVNDNPVDRKVCCPSNRPSHHHTLIQAVKVAQPTWGQPYELAENGQEAVDMYKRDPERFRCILMDLVMPIMDGFEATRQIRTYEEESWNAFSSAQFPLPGVGPSRTSRDTPKPIRRTVIIALVPSYSVTGLRQRIADTGFDLSFCRPFHLGTMGNMLFSGPGMNVVGLYGGVDDSQLKDAGYPLQIKRRKPGSIGDREVGEALGRAVS
ncbi:putative Response regulatory domain-containing protein [Seiridium unicorne]|uniref:Response regulatory domain-containing protein n=1 Tax=Seiridium unicorne TaxID=138068 RepID=A0ABR2UU62_9PEZI